MQINDFKVNCYNRTEAVPTRCLVGKFTAKLETYSQLNAILEMMDDLEQNLDGELKSCSEKLSKLNLTTTTEDVTKYHRINFLCDQMELNAVKQHGARCNPGTMKDSINLYLRSRNCYNAICELMVLPHKNTIKSYFGKLGSPGSKQECSKVIQNVFSSLTGLEKHCKILIDEIYIKPGAQYQGGHIIGYAEDEPSKIAKTVLALMISTQMGKPAFVARLILVYSLTAEFLFDQVSKLIEIIHENSGFVYMAMNDNLRANQKMFSIFHKTYKPRSLFSIAHPIPNDTIDELFLLYDPTHLLKNIRNN